MHESATYLLHTPSCSWFSVLEWIQRIIFAAETNAADIHTQTAWQRESVTDGRRATQYLIRSLSNGEGKRIHCVITSGGSSRKILGEGHCPHLPLHHRVYFLCSPKPKKYELHMCAKKVTPFWYLSFIPLLDALYLQFLFTYISFTLNAWYHSQCWCTVVSTGGLSSRMIHHHTLWKTR